MNKRLVAAVEGAMRKPHELPMRDLVFGDEGLALGLRFSQSETAWIREQIESQWLATLSQAVPEHADQFAQRGVAHYHELAHLVDHAQLWPKRTRLFPPEVVSSIREMGPLLELEKQFGPFAISAEEGTGSEEMYWRIVRPRQPADIGPLHADKWFWDLGHGEIPAGTETVKVWVAVVCESGLSGLRVVPGSQHRQWRYHAEERDGKRKPQIDEPEDAINPQLLATAPGDAVVFHELLLHGGAVGMGELCRVSFEFTMFVKKDDAQA